MDEDEKGEGYRSRMMRSSRAKNQTVMLTPEIAGQVRAAVKGEEKGSHETSSGGRPDIFERPAQFGASRNRPPMGGEGFDNFRGQDSMSATRLDNSPFRDPEDIPEEPSGRYGFEPPAQAAKPGPFREPKGGTATMSRSAIQQHLSQTSLAQPEAEVDLMENEEEEERFAVPVSPPPVRKESPIRVREEGYEPVVPVQSPVAPSIRKPVKEEIKPEPIQETTKMTNTTVRLVTKSELTKLAGFFVSFDVEQSGEVVELRKGRWTLSSKPSQEGNCIVLEDASISSSHAIIRVTNDGKIQVLDQLSEFGTGILRNGADEEEEIEGAMVTLEHGDRVRFGKRYFFVCILPA